MLPFFTDEDTKQKMPNGPPKKETPSPTNVNKLYFKLRAKRPKSNVDKYVNAGITPITEDFVSDSSYLSSDLEDEVTENDNTRQNIKCFTNF